MRTHKSHDLPLPSLFKQRSATKNVADKLPILTRLFPAVNSNNHTNYRRTVDAPTGARIQKGREQYIDSVHRGNPNTIAVTLPQRDPTQCRIPLPHARHCRRLGQRSPTVG